MNLKNITLSIIGFAALVLTLRYGFEAKACPFCSSIAPTFTERIEKSEIVVLVTLKEKPPAFDPNSEEIPKGKFSVIQIMKGEQWVEQGYEIQTPIFGKHEVGDVFLVMGVEPPKTSWSTPQTASSRLIKYLEQIQSLPEKGPKRLKFFLEYLEDKEDVLSADAYDEFARAPYDDVIAIKESMDHDKLIKWLTDPEVLTIRKRLYYTLLGVCGSTDDLPLLESIMTDEDRKKRQGLDSLIACYLTLSGPKGLDFIDQHFLANADVEFSDSFSAVSALRFHSNETEKIPRDRIVESLRKSLDSTLMADVVIPDLARLKDWTVMDRLAKMYSEVNEDERWVRIPIVSYMKVCPLPKAKEHVEKFREIDAESVKRAEILMESSWDDGWGDEEDEDETSDDKKQDDDKQSAKFEKSKEGDPVFEKSGKKDDSKKESDRHTVKKQPITYLGDAPQNNTDNTVGSDTRDAAQITASANPKALAESSSKPEIAGNVPKGSEAIGTNAGGGMQTGDDFVSSRGVSSIARDGDFVSQNSATTARATESQLPPSILSILMVSFAGSTLIFLLCWSVLNGWFLRLIY